MFMQIIIRKYKYLNGSEQTAISSAELAEIGDVDVIPVKHSVVSIFCSCRDGRPIAACTQSMCYHRSNYSALGWLKRPLCIFFIS